MNRIGVAILNLIGVAILCCIAASAHAAQCTLPYVLQNGTIPDATQVMADFYALLNCVNSGGGGGGGTGITLITLATPPEFPETGSPCTGPSCNFTITKAPENANTVFAGPSTGSPAIPTFRTIGCPDLPAGGCPFDIVLNWPSTPPNAALVRIGIDRSVSCPVALSGSVGIAKTAATATTTVNINQVTAGVDTNRGSVQWAASGTVGTFNSTAITFAANDIAEFAFPVTADASLGDVSITLKCVRI